MQVIRFGAAEAVTQDGVRWDIYVSNDTLLDGLDDGAGGAGIQVSDIRYGSWTAARGLKRGPIHPSSDFYRMERMGAVVYEALLDLQDQLPFPFRDRHELWLLDHSDAPLCLLHSAVTADEATLPGPDAWEVGQAARDGFTSPALAECAPQRPDQSAGAYLMDFVNRRGAGTAWFRREADGGGSRLDGTGAPLARLAPADFPPLLLATHGFDTAHRRLAEHFFAWQAPCLLLLADLDVDSRRRLEPLARRQAAQVAGHYRLYPSIVDPAQIQAARVEARLLDAHTQHATVAEAGLPTYYIELNPSELNPSGAE